MKMAFIVIISFIILGCYKTTLVDVNLQRGNNWEEKAAGACKELEGKTYKDSCWVTGMDKNLRAKCRCK